MSDRVQELMLRARHARWESHLLDSHRDFTAAVALCRQAGSRSELVDALKGLGQIERDQGRGEIAQLLYEEAVSICRGEDDALQLAHAVRHLGDIHQKAGRLDMAQPCYTEAIALYRRESGTAPLDLANAIRPLALLKEREAKVKEAIPLWSEARDLYTAADVRAGVAECSAHLDRLGE